MDSTMPQEGMSELEWLQMEQEKEMIMLALNESLRMSSQHSSSFASLLSTSDDTTTTTSQSFHDSTTTTTTTNNGGGREDPYEKKTSAEGGIPDGMSELEWLQMEQEKEMIMAAMRESLHISSSSSSSLGDGLMQQAEDDAETKDYAVAKGKQPYSVATTTTTTTTPSPPAASSAASKEEATIPNGMSELEWLQMEQEKEMIVAALNESMKSRSGGGSSSSSSTQLFATTSTTEEDITQRNHQQQQQPMIDYYPTNQDTRITAATRGQRRSITTSSIHRPTDGTAVVVDRRISNPHQNTTAIIGSLGPRSSSSYRTTTGIRGGGVVIQQGVAVSNTTTATGTGTNQHQGFQDDDDTMRSVGPRRRRSNSSASRIRTTTNRPGVVAVSNHNNNNSDHKEWQAKMNAKLYNFKVQQQQQKKSTSTTQQPKQSKDNNVTAVAHRPTKGHNYY